VGRWEIEAANVAKNPLTLWLRLMLGSVFRLSLTRLRLILDSPPLLTEVRR
jgi:hypothetical protein